MKSFSNHIILSFLIFNFSFLIFRFSSCTSSSHSTNSQNLSHIYKTKQDGLHPKFAVFHRTGTTSELHFKINSKDLLYTKQGDDGTFSARISIQYRLISSYETKDIIDSATVTMSDPFSSTPRDIIGKIDFSATFTNGYVLQIDLTDMNRNITSKTFINIDKLDHNTRQNFIVLAGPTKGTDSVFHWRKNKIPVFRDNIGRDERFFIKYRTPDETIHVRYYHRDFPLPSPPFATSNMIPFEYHADSLFTLQLDEKDTVGIKLNSPGFYHIQADTNTKDGLTLFRFEDDFPKVKKPIDLLQPLRYLTTKQEYEVLSGYKNLKTAVDSFWVYAGGSHERARSLVKKFYNRVEDSNEYFSSYLEGWRTDRGLMYIIYGPPNIVYKSSDSESWVYGEENNFNSLTFTFLKVINPFTDNDYRLERNQIFKTSWFNSVEMWRQGRVYAEK